MLEFFQEPDPDSFAVPLTKGWGIEILEPLQSMNASNLNKDVHNTHQFNKNDTHMQQSSATKRVILLFK